METDLRRLRAAGLDEALLDRLDACTDATWTELKPEEIRFERQLLEIAPAKLPPALMASLEAKLQGVPFSTDQTIVRFPLNTAAAPQRHQRGWWAAAAAVALTGAVTALLIPTGQGPEKLADTKQTRIYPNPSPTGGELVPAGYNSDLSEASDQGVVWNANRQPHRVVKVVYMDRVTLKDASGRTYQVEQPRVEYILVPTKTD